MELFNSSICHIKTTTVCIDRDKTHTFEQKKNCATNFHVAVEIRNKRKCTFRIPGIGIINTGISEIPL